MVVYERKLLEKIDFIHGSKPRDSLPSKSKNQKVALVRTACVSGRATYSSHPLTQVVLTGTTLTSANVNGKTLVSKEQSENTDKFEVRSRVIRL